MRPFAQALRPTGATAGPAFHPPVQRATVPMHTAMSPGAVHAPGAFAGSPASPFQGQRTALGTEMLRQHLLATALRGGMGPGGPQHPPMLAPARPAFPTIK
jgi:hypothetical protein